MYAEKPYRRLQAVNYARTWAQSRNPLFQNFAECGGDCTNFISQCIFAGSCTMNETETFGWYYRAPGDYAPAWTGVPYFYNFLVSNTGIGPFGHEVSAREAEPGDIVQLGTREGTFYHSLIITGSRGGSFLVCAHNNDALDRPLVTYEFERIRYIHIDGVRIAVPGETCCYEGLIAGTSIFPTEEESEAGTCSEPSELPLPTEPEQPEDAEPVIPL